MCVGVSFLPSSPGYGMPGQVVQIAFGDGVVNPYYYFPPAAFTIVEPTALSISQALTLAR